MSSDDRTSPERTELEVRWDQPYFRRIGLMLALVFLVYIAIAAFAAGTSRFMGIAGAIVFGVMALMGARQGWGRPVAVATLNESGVTFARHDSAAWEIFREVRFGLVKPRLLFVLRPLHYIAFVPHRVADLPRTTPRERLAIHLYGTNLLLHLYGTNLLLMTETVSPSGDDILAAVKRLSNVPVRR